MIYWKSWKKKHSLNFVNNRLYLFDVLNSRKKKEKKNEKIMCICCNFKDLVYLLNCQHSFVGNQTGWCFVYAQHKRRFLFYIYFFVLFVCSSAESIKIGATAWVHSFEMNATFSTWIIFNIIISIYWGWTWNINKYNSLSRLIIFLDLYTFLCCTRYSNCRFESQNILSFHSIWYIYHHWIKFQF